MLNALQLFHEMDRLFQRAFDLMQVPPLLPAALPASPLQVEDAGPEVIMRAQLPGADPQSLEVRLGETALSVRARGQQEIRAERDGMVQASAQRSELVATVPLPVLVDPAGARASFQNGILEVRAPKRATLPVQSL